MKRSLWLPGALLVLAGLSPRIAAGEGATVTLVNDSKWDIHHLFLSASDETEWGEDQLGEAVLEARGGRFQLREIPCDTYDVMLVDEDGDDCVVPEVDICAESQKWVITSDDLLDCEGFGG
jgi:hypothetical protein